MAIGECSTADYEHCCMTTETKQKQYNNTQLRPTIINLAVSCMYHGYHTWYSLNLVDDMDHIFVAIPYADMGVFNAYTRFVWSRLVHRYYPTRTLTVTLTRTRWSDQCLDAVPCESSNLIRPTWMLCVERLHVDWTLIRPARDAVGYCITYIKQTRCTH